MYAINKQHGMTAGGWIMVIGLIAFFALTGMKLFPIYMQSITIDGVLKSMKEEPGIVKKTERQIQKMIWSRLLVNQIENVKQDDFYIEKNGDVLLISVEYEDRRDYLGNLDVIASFKKEIEIVRN